MGQATTEPAELFPLRGGPGLPLLNARDGRTYGKLTGGGLVDGFCQGVTRLFANRLVDSSPQRPLSLTCPASGPKISPQSAKQ